MISFNQNNYKQVPDELMRFVNQDLYQPTGSKSLPYTQTSFMLLNLSRDFQFSRNSEDFAVDYLFTEHHDASNYKNVSLVMNISVNQSEKQMHRLSKPTSILYQSNEAIEKIIEDEAILFSKQ